MRPKVKTRDKFLDFPLSKRLVSKVTLGSEASTSLPALFDTTRPVIPGEFLPVQHDRDSGWEECSALPWSPLLWSLSPL